MLSTAYVYYIYMIFPFLIQSFRRTKPLVIFDDINKIDHIGQLAEISRYLQLHEENMGNVILISSDEETWFKLRKEPGLKDRLRQRVITYNHSYTAQ
jgi:Cdc6-like AAA superfamily ATPase